MNKPVLKVVPNDLPPRMIAAMVALSEEAKDLDACLCDLWQERAQNLKKAGHYNVQAVKDSIRADVMNACKNGIYSAPEVAAITAVVDGFRPEKKSHQVRSLAFTGRSGGAA